MRRTAALVAVIALTTAAPAWAARTTGSPDKPVRQSRGTLETSLRYRRWGADMKESTRTEGALTTQLHPDGRMYLRTAGVHTVPGAGSTMLRQVFRGAITSRVGNVWRVRSEGEDHRATVERQINEGLAELGLDLRVWVTSASADTHVSVMGPLRMRSTARVTLGGASSREDGGEALRDLVGQELILETSFDGR